MSTKKDIKPQTTRYPSPIKPNPRYPDRASKIEAISVHFREILSILGLDLDNDSLKETPMRIAEMYINEVFSGLEEDTFPELCMIADQFGDSKGRLIMVKDVTVMSFCEHHFVPMIGVAHVAYVPKEKIIGLSKINRLVRYFSRRPQVQERLTAQIADCLIDVLSTPDVAVHINARHHCVAARGITDMSSTTTTYVLHGAFQKDPELRGEFFANFK